MPFICSRQEAYKIVHQLSRRIEALFPRERPDVILFGSYARQEAEEGSDIDVLYLVDASREDISEKNWQIGAAAADLLLEHGVMVSPLVENRAFFQQHEAALPFYRSIRREGVRIRA